MIRGYGGAGTIDCTVGGNDIIHGGKALDVVFGGRADDNISSYEGEGFVAGDSANMQFQTRSLTRVVDHFESASNPHPPGGYGPWTSSSPAR